ncbi:MAG TPA: type II toxin-antitoxin system death-on-curing family toxin [Ktedonobacterales bacterium]|nr:type II toxin-antitoxin system death-on-curing family toxin [Ktedonobacterales bacterium]
MFYLIVAEVHSINEAVLALEGQQSLLVDEGKLESALMRPQMSAHYKEADLAHQTALLASGIALAHAFIDGNKRTALLAGRTFLALNGYRLERAPLEFAEAILALVNHTDSVEAAIHHLAEWIRTRLRPQS